jgi:hypothetical protein
LEITPFEIDHDMRKMFSHLGLKQKDSSSTHEIADVIAYCNSKNRRISGIPEIDLTEDLKTSLSKRLHI